MKRARASTPDLVYPFDEGFVTPMPPFLDAGSGLEVSGLKLAVKSIPPLGTKNNALTVKIGPGLSINNNGELVSSSSVTAQPPLDNSGGSLQLNISDPLDVVNNKLTVKTGNGLQLDSNNALMVKTTSALSNSTDGLAINTTAPINVSGGTLSLNVSNNFSVSQGSLTLTRPSLPLQVGSQGQIELLSSNAFSTTGGVLDLHPPTAPLTITSGSLTLNTDNTMRRVNNQLGLNQPIVPLTLTNGQLGVNLSTDTMEVKNSSLSVKLDQTGPVSSTGAGLTLNVDQNAGLEVKQSSLALKTDPTGPVTTGPGGLNLQISPNTLTVTNNSLDVKLDANGPITSTSNGLTMGVSAPLTVSGKSISLKTGDGIKTSNGAVTLDIGNGLQMTNSQLSIQTENPLTTFNGPLQLLTPSSSCLEVLSNGLSIQVDPLDCIKKGPSGLKLLKKAPIINTYTSDGWNTALTLNYDESDFEVSNTKLTLKRKPNTIYTLQLGYNKFDVADITVQLNLNKGAAKISAYVYLSIYGGVVSGTIQIRGYAGKFPKIGDSIRDYIRFGLVICPTAATDHVANLSGFPAPTVTPDEPSTAPLFKPNHWTSDEILLTLPSSGNWYVDLTQLPSNNTVAFTPGGSPGLDFMESRLYFTPAKVTGATADYNVIYCLFDLIPVGGSTNFFDPNTDSNTFFKTPPIPIQYMAYQ